jgi:uroporphyrinogen III methyltransferase/synthase
MTLSEGSNSDSEAPRARPLKGRTILVTRAKSQAKEFGEALEQAGAAVVYFPTIEITPPDSWVECDTAIRHLNTYDLIAFTSVNAVDHFFGRALAVDGWSLPTIRQKKVFAVGEKTRSALESHGCMIEALPEKATAEELGHLLQQSELKGKRVLLPRGNLATQVLPKLLQQSGAIVDEVIVYQTRKPEIKGVEPIQQMLANQAIDAVTFFSPSSVQNFIDLIPSINLDGVAVAAIGEVTAAAARQAGMRVDVVPPNPTFESMAISLADFFSRATTGVT